MWVAGGVIGGLLALWVMKEGAVGQMPPSSPPPVGQKLLPQPAPNLEPTPAPSATPNRNEIRLPLRPIKNEPGPFQVRHPPTDPNAIDADGVTPFMQAAGKGDVNGMEQFYRQGVQVNQMDRWAHTALYYAIRAKSGPAVNWLIAHGVEPDGICCDGAHSPFLHALDTGDFAVIEPLLRSDRRPQWCAPARETLFRALRMGDKRFVRALLAGHCAPPTLEDSRQPLLGYAIVWGDEELLETLLECGADPNSGLMSPVDRRFSRYIDDRSLREYLETEPGMTPLMLAAGMGRVDFVQLLLQYGAKRGMTSRRYKMTAIDLAARRDARPEMLQVLLGKSPRPEDQRMRIDISIGDQRAVFYKDGQVALVTPISTGRPGFPTPTGQFVVTDKDRMHRSTLYPAYMPYFLRMSCRDFGLHAGDLPGYPASHGCVRLPWGSAEQLYREVDVGTLVTISR
jgi:ankyrin repeat protein